MPAFELNEGWDGGGEKGRRGWEVLRQGGGENDQGTAVTGSSFSNEEPSFLARDHSFVAIHSFVENDIYVSRIHPHPARAQLVTKTIPCQSAVQREG